MNHLKILKGVSLIILLLCACTEDYDILTNKSRDIDIKSDLDIARNWYNQQQIAHGMETRSDNLDVNPIPVKDAVNRIGYAAGPCRMPLVPLSEANQQKMQATLEKYGLIK